MAANKKLGAYICKGCGIADRLDIKPGDSLVSSPENLFDLAGVYPLRMKVVYC